MSLLLREVRAALPPQIPDVTGSLLPRLHVGTGSEGVVVGLFSHHKLSIPVHHSSSAVISFRAHRTLPIGGLFPSLLNIVSEAPSSLYTR